MGKYELSLIARQDLILLWDYLAEEVNEQVADQQLDMLHAKCQQLAKAPLMGRARPELAANLKSLPAYPYMLFYEVIAEQHVIIQRVLHPRQDVGTSYP